MLSLSAILKNPPPDAELLELVARALGAWPDKIGLTFVSEGTLTDEPTLKIDVWTEDADPTLEINLVRDDEAACRYVSAVAPDEEPRRLLYEQLLREFDVVSLAELQEQARRAGESDPASYLRLALGTNGVFDETSFELIRDGLRSPQVEARAQAAMSAGLVRWPQFADAAGAALDFETDEGVARLLAAAVTLCRPGQP